MYFLPLFDQVKLPWPDMSTCVTDTETSLIGGKVSGTVIQHLPLMASPTRWRIGTWKVQVQKCSKTSISVLFHARRACGSAHSRVPATVAL